jgi:hypothetical protein
MRERMKKHWDMYCNGLYFVCKATRDSDIYENMRVPEGMTRNKYNELIKSLALADCPLVWIPDKRVPSHNYYRKDVSQTLYADLGWLTYVREDLCDLEAFRLIEENKAIEENKTYEEKKANVEEIESRLQIALGMHFRLGYYDHRERQTWLGDIECLDDARVSEFKRGEFKTVLQFSESNLDRLEIDEGQNKDVRKVFRDDTNKALISQYFAQKDSPFAPF